MTDLDAAAVSAWMLERGLPLRQLEKLPGDVSARQYARARLADGRSAIVAHYPRELRESCDRFRQTTELLEGAGVRVPRLLSCGCSEGLMALEDAGEQTLYELREEPLEDRLVWFERAVDTSLRIARLDPAEVGRLNPRLDGAWLRRELQQTVDSYLAPADLLGDKPTRRRIESALDRLCTTLGEAPPAPCHRDFMCRNLVPAGCELIVLDHQDLRLGPPGYDLASLLNDSFYPPPSVEQVLLARAKVDPVDYHRAAAQRTLKAIGTFATFAARGSDRHLPLIPPTLARSLTHLAHAPETEQLAPQLRELWAPVFD